jgi:uncharacterized BrkB/YihY/UPF0761 family membrane protein
MKSLSPNRFILRHSLIFVGYLSTVNVIHGSLTGVAIALTTLYVIGLIILLGAQVRTCPKISGTS